LGELALGHAGFIAIGAYTTALTTLNMDLPTFLQIPVSLLLGGILAGIFGILIGIPALRLRGDYLGIITLGFGEIIRVAIFNLEITRGSKGITGIPQLASFGWTFVVMALTVFVLHRLIKSRHGRAILSIREDEIAAESIGIPTTYYKITAFSISAFFAGIGGGLFAYYMQMIDPKKFNFIFSVEILIIVVLGGMGSLTGSIIAAIILTILPEALRIGDMEQYRLLIYSILLIVMMIFRPEGLVGRREFSFKGIYKAISNFFNKIGKRESR
jgi:branched-chain amino acid transport system permease protein